MNKSIVLVMCDILVLSAMSLSSGGFSEADELDVRKMQNIDFDVVSRDEYEALQEELEKVEISTFAKLDAANAKAAEAQKREENAKAAEKAAREAEALAKIQAKEATEHAAQAKQDAEAARASEAQAEAVAETARKNEAVANAKAAEAQKREVEAKAAEKAARKAESLAKNQAEEAAAQEARAKAEAETARANEAYAKAEAEMARKNEMEANELAHEAQQREEQAKAELAEIRVRQKALVGDIPRKISWEMAIHTIHTKKRNKKPKTRFSPLIASPSGCFLFVEVPKIGDVKSYADIVSIVATHDTLLVTGELFRVEGHDDWLFVKIRDSFDMPHIGFGVESIGLDDNIVYYPDDQGKCSGNAVPCAIDNDGHFTCSVKTETRTIGQRIVGEGHSVYDGCFLLSTTRGSLGAIVRGDNPLVAERKCEVISPFLETDLVRIK